MKLGYVVGGWRRGGETPGVGFEGRSNVEGFVKMNNVDLGIFRDFGREFQGIFYIFF